MSVISPAEGVRERLNRQSSPVCPAEWTIPLSLHLLGRSLLNTFTRPFGSSFLAEKAVCIISAQREGIKALTSVYLNSVYRSLPHRKQFYHEETQENVLQVMKHKLASGALRNALEWRVVLSTPSTFAVASIETPHVICKVSLINQMP